MDLLLPSPPRSDERATPALEDGRKPRFFYDYRHEAAPLLGRGLLSRIL